MAEAINGVNRIILMRPEAMRGDIDAGRLAFQTEHEVTRSRDSDSMATKDGNIVSTSDISVEMSVTSILAQTDPMRNKLLEAFEANELMEFWDIDKTAPELSGENAGKFPATYYQGYVTEWGENAPADAHVELSLTIAINGSGVRGYATLSEEQSTVVQYPFRNTTAGN